MFASGRNDIFCEKNTGFDRFDSVSAAHENLVISFSEGFGKPFLYRRRISELW